MRSVLQSFKAEVGFPLSDDYLINRLVSRGLCPEDVCRADTIRSREFQLAVADTLIGLVRMPNIQEGDMRIDLTNRSLLVNQANSIYRAYGEPTVGEHDKPKPMVKIGWG